MSLPVATLARGADSGIAAPRTAVVRDETAWRALWAAHAGPQAQAPAVDFSSNIVAAAFAGERPDPSYTLAITGARKEGDAVVVTVAEPRAAGGIVAAQILVSPFHIVALPRVEGEVRFEAAVPGREAAVSGGPPPGASSTGLDPNFAAALAYLAGPFSGLLIAVIERRSRYVAFHAWQAVLGLGGLAALAAGALVCSFLTLLISPLAFTVMYRFSEAAAILWVGVWLWCLVMAFTGRAAKLPVAGRHAERLAAGLDRPASRIS